MKALNIIFACALAACASNNSGPTKGSSATGSDAKAAGQKTGSTASGDTGMATNDGDTYEGVTCDDTEEGVAWCDSDTTIVFCTGGVWYALDCTSIGGDFCAETDDTVDCYAITD
jgi:hypothetical protein